MIDGPYKLPEGWRWVRLGEVAWREANLLKPSEEPNKRFRYLGMEQIKSGQWEEPQPIEVEGHEIKSQVVKFRPGIVLYGRLRPYLNKVAVPLFEGVASTEFVPIATRQDVLISHYLCAFLRSPAFVTYASNNTTGSRQPRVRYEAIWKALIPLPPFNEQRRIVAKVEMLMEQVREARCLRQKAVEDTDRLWQAVLADTFPCPGTDLPPNWRWVRLGEVASRPQYGFTKSATLHPIGPKFVRITDITSGEIDWSKVPYCECDTKKLGKYRLYPGDVLFARSGSVGATILIKETPYDAVFASYLIRVRFRESVLSEFTNLLLKAPVCQRQLIPQGAAQKNINARLIESILIPLPPMSEQRRIVAYLKVVQKKIKFLEESQAQFETELQRLEQSILDSAFKGEL